MEARHSSVTKKSTRIYGELFFYILDTYAWIEYLIGSKKGEIVRRLFQNQENQFLSLECSLSELKGWTLRENKDFTELYSIVKANSHIEAVHLQDWLAAAEIKSEMRKTMKDFGLIDALLIAKQKRYNCKIVSGDPHFENLQNVVYIR